MPRIDSGVTGSGRALLFSCRGQRHCPVSISYLRTCGASHGQPHSPQPAAACRCAAGGARARDTAQRPDVDLAVVLRLPLHPEARHLLSAALWQLRNLGRHELQRADSAHGRVLQRVGGQAEVAELHAAVPHVDQVLRLYVCAVGEGATPSTGCEWPPTAQAVRLGEGGAPLWMMPRACRNASASVRGRITFSATDHSGRRRSGKLEATCSRSAEGARLSAAFGTPCWRQGSHVAQVAARGILLDEVQAARVLPVLARYQKPYRDLRRCEKK